MPHTFLLNPFHRRGKVMVGYGWFGVGMGGYGVLTGGYWWLKVVKSGYGWVLGMGDPIDLPHDLLGLLRPTP